MEYMTAWRAKEWSPDLSRRAQPEVRWPQLPPEFTGLDGGATLQTWTFDHGDHGALVWSYFRAARRLEPTATGSI